MDIIKQVEYLTELRAQAESLTEQVMKDLEPVIEDWSDFVEEFVAEWRKQNADEAGRLPFFPWKALGRSSDYDSPAVPARVSDWTVEKTNFDGGALSLGGQDYDGDWVSGVIPVDFITDREASKQRLTKRWTERAAAHLAYARKVREEQDRREFERLKAKFDK